MTTTRVAILAFEGCVGMEVFAVADVLLVANRVSQRLNLGRVRPFKVEIVSLAGGMVAMAGGHQIRSRQPAARIDCLVVPGFDFARDSASIQAGLEAVGAECDFIRAKFRRGIPIASICVGAFLLGEAGILDGRRATTAWLCREPFARRYPGVRLDINEKLVEDGGVITTGAVAASLDAAIHLVRKYAGAALAQAVARIVLANQSPGSQAPFVDAALSGAGRGGFATAVEGWLVARLQQPFALERLAAAFHVSPRTLLRRFKAESGTTPLACLQNARIERAKRLLATSGASIAAITEAVGYSDPASFTQLFRREVKVTPAAYRRSFVEPARRPGLPQS